MAVIQKSLDHRQKPRKVDECPRDGGYVGIKEDRSLLASS